MFVGEADGALEGVKVGDALGLAVGEALGVWLGELVGETLGVWLGELVGKAIGVGVGAEVGVAEGAALGLSVGDTVGALVGAGVGLGSGLNWRLSSSVHTVPEVSVDTTVTPASKEGRPHREIVALVLSQYTSPVSRDGAAPSSRSVVSP